MTQRQPESDRNWDVEEEVEESGQFVQAPSCVLEQRHIMKAKRRATSETLGGVGGAFSGFTGLTAGAAQISVSTSSSVFQPPNATSCSDISSNKVQFLNSLKLLNESLLLWVEQHVRSSPYCLLTPIFTDYSRHLSGLQQKYPYSDQSTTGVAPPSMFGTHCPKVPQNIVFGTSAPVSTTSMCDSVTQHSQTSDAATSSITPHTGFTAIFSSQQHEQAAVSTAPEAGFFKDKITFSQMAARHDTDSEQVDDEDKDNDEYVPPLAEVLDSTEEGEIHRVECKLYYLQPTGWKKKGPGVLVLKSCNDKTQLLVRADNKIGTIMLNILLHKSMPVSRTGSNAVTLVCVPNPPCVPNSPNKVTPLLITVKTALDADTLYAKINDTK